MGIRALFLFFWLSSTARAAVDEAFNERMHLPEGTAHVVETIPVSVRDQPVLLRYPRAELRRVPRRSGRTQLLVLYDPLSARELGSVDYTFEEKGFVRLGTARTATDLPRLGVATVLYERMGEMLADALGTVTSWEGDNLRLLRENTARLEAAGAGRRSSLLASYTTPSARLHARMGLYLRGRASPGQEVKFVRDPEGPAGELGLGHGRFTLVPVEWDERNGARVPTKWRMVNHAPERSLFCLATVRSLDPVQ